jgi:hypothetical protein
MSQSFKKILARNYKTKSKFASQLKLSLLIIHSIETKFKKHTKTAVNLTLYKIYNTVQSKMLN